MRPSPIGRLTISAQTMPVIAQLAECMPGGFFLYHADGDQELIYANSRVAEIYRCGSDAEFRELVHNSFRGMVHPDDLDACQRDIALQIQMGSGFMDQVRYRIVRADGSIGLINDYGYLTHSDEYGDVFCVFIDDLSDDGPDASRLSVMSALAEDYEILFHYDLDSREIDVFQAASWVDQSRIPEFSALPLEKKVQYFADRHVAPEDQVYFQQYLTSEKIAEAIRTGEPLSFRFRTNHPSAAEWYELKLAHHRAHAGKNCVIVGLRNVTAEMETRDLLRHQAFRDRQHLLTFHNIIHSGMWNITLDADSNIVRVRWSKEYLHLLGFENEQDFPDTLEAWSDRLHPDDRERTLQLFWEGARSREPGTVFDTDFRMLTRNGTYCWYHAAGRVEPNEDGTYLYFGIFVDSSVQHNNEQYQALQKQNLDIINILASEYSSVYYIDLTTDQLTPYSMNAETESEFGQIFNSGITYSEAFELYVQRLVHPDDQEMMLREGAVENIRSRLEHQKSFSTLYRSSDNRYNEMRFVKVGSESDPPLAVALGFADRDEQIRTKKEQESTQARYISAVKALSDEYSTVFFADFDQGSLIPYSVSDRHHTLFRIRPNHSYPITLSTENFIRLDCMDHDRTLMKKSLSPKWLREELAAKSHVSVVFRDGRGQYCEMKAVRVGPEGQVRQVVVGFANKDQEIRSRLQAERERQRHYDIIEILASEYSSVFYIDLKTDTLVPYITNAGEGSLFGDLPSESLPYSKTFRRYVSERVYSEDRDMMLLSGSIGNIMKELRDKKTFLTPFRNTDGRYSEMKYVKVGNHPGFPTAVVLGIADKDAELRSKAETMKTQQRNIDIIEILASEYSSVYYIDLTTDELDPYSMNEQTESELGSVFRSGIHFSDAFRLYVNTKVFEEDRERMLKAGSIFNILKELSTKKTFITTYRNAEGHYAEMKFVKVGDGDNPKAVALAFSDKNQEVQNAMNLKVLPDSSDIPDTT